MQNVPATVHFVARACRRAAAARVGASFTKLSLGRSSHTFSVPPLAVRDGIVMSNLNSSQVL